MLKAKGILKGRETFILGITKENVRRLKAGDPIYLASDKFNISHDLLLLYRNNLQDLIKTLGIDEKGVIHHELTPGSTYGSGEMKFDPPAYLIWSNEHSAWWKPNKQGYTTIIEEAGKYSVNEAKEIAAEANAPQNKEPGQDFDNEVLVLAPLGL